MSDKQEEEVKAREIARRMFQEHMQRCSNLWNLDFFQVVEWLIFHIQAAKRRRRSGATQAKATGGQRPEAEGEG